MECRWRREIRDVTDLPLLMAALTWVLAFAAGIVGIWIGERLPEEHRTDQSRAAVARSMGMVGTLTAIALGLLISVANTSFRDKQEQVMSSASNIIRMDHLLRMYGPDADGARAFFREYATSMMNDVFPAEEGRSDIENEATLDIAAKAEHSVVFLAPADDIQRWLQPHMLDVVNKLVEEHFELVKQGLDAIPDSLMVLMLFWLVLLFGSYGLYSPMHLTSMIFLFLASGAASGAVLLIIELETPHRGFVHLSPDPLQHAVDVMTHYAGGKEWQD